MKEAKATQRSVDIPVHESKTKRPLENQRSSFEGDSGDDWGASGWRDRQVKDLGEIVTGRTPSTKRKDFYDGEYHPLLSQGLVFLKLMEERGTGIRRMRAAMLDYGLELPHVTLDEDRFVLTLPGPGNDLGRIKAPSSASESLPKSALEELNKRQLAILERLAAGEELTSARMQSDFSVTRETVARDMAALIELKLAQKIGKARATRYIYAPSKSSGIVR